MQQTQLNTSTDSQYTHSRLHAWIAASPLRSMGHTVLMAAATTLFARILGFCKEIVVAASFGLSSALDVYLVAFVLISMPLSILLNAVQTALIRHLSVGVNAEEAARHFSGTCLFTLTTLAIALPLWLLLLPYVLPWLVAGFSSDKRQALETALIWLVPYYFLSGFNLLGYGVLQAKRRFLANGLLPAATPLVIMIGVYLWGGSGDWLVLVVALTAGTVIESGLLLLVLGQMGLLARPSTLKGIKTIASASLALFPGTLVLAFGPVVDQAIAAALGEGSNASLAYGYKLPSAMQSILLTAIGITALPYFSTQIAQGKYAYSLHSLNKLAVVLLVGGALLALPLGLFSVDIAELLYQRGAFSAEDTARVAPVQLAYFIQIPFAMVAILGIKTLAALNRNGLLSVYATLGLLLQALFAYAFAARFGVPGIAWAAVIVSALLAVISYLTSRNILLRVSK